MYACTRHVYTHVCVVSKCGVLSLGESGRGTVAGQRRNSDGGLEGCTVEERWCTVVFHSHYRNVLPCALVAPRNKSSVTVTMVGVQGGNGRCAGGGRGLLWRSTLPAVRISPRATRSVRNSRNLFFLSFSRSHLGSFV